MKKVTQTADKERFSIIQRKYLLGLFSACKFKKRQTKLILFLMAKIHYKEGHVTHCGGDYTCRRGEYITTITYLMQKTGWSRYEVNQTLNSLQSNSLIETEPVRNGIRIRLTAYTHFLDIISRRKENVQAKPSVFDDDILNGPPEELRKLLE